MNQNDFLLLIDRYLEGKASEEEREWLHRYYNHLQHTNNWNEEELGNCQATEKSIWQRIKKLISEEAVVVPLYHRRWVKLAAAVFLLVSLSALWITSISPASKTRASNVYNGNAASKPQEPVLIMASGEVFLLDAVADGVLAERDNAVIYKSGNRITIQAQTPTSARVQVYHVIKIPRSKQYEVVLADGTHVWLNAASTLQFPTVFATSERKVKVTGEAYFEVAKVAAKPFRVHAFSSTTDSGKGALVEVLGTHFNISAYGDEALLKTTLLEGKVTVKGMEEKSTKVVGEITLLPGEQAQFSTNAPASVATVQTVDVESVTAWKRNYFDFQSADTKTIMRQLSRWYDVQVVYEGPVPRRTFSGKISRTTALETVLEILEQSGIHFRRKDKTLVVRS